MVRSLVPISPVHEITPLEVRARSGHPHLSETLPELGVRHVIHTGVSNEGLLRLAPGKPMPGAPWTPTKSSTDPAPASRALCEALCVSRSARAILTMVAGYGYRAFGDQSFRVLVVRSPLLWLGS